MNLFLSTLLGIHVFAGILALFVGLVPMIGKKGNRLHKRTGLIYVWCMIVVAITAGLLCGLQPFKMRRLFLAGIAVFSFYLCFTGWRATKQKTGRYTRYDHWLTYAGLATGLIMVGMGTYLMLNADVSFLPIVFTFFGVLTTRFAWQDYRLHRKPALKMGWFFQHFTRMGGSYIATFTAAIVTNIDRFAPANSPEWLGTLCWIAPSVLGGLLIGLTVARYRKRFRVRPVAEVRL